MKGEEDADNDDLVELRPRIKGFPKVFSRCPTKRTPQTLKATSALKMDARMWRNMLFSAQEPIFYQSQH
jgi:hypothetical protein